MDSKFEIYVPPIWVECTFFTVSHAGDREPQLEHPTCFDPQLDNDLDLQRDSEGCPHNAMPNYVPASQTTDLGICPISGYKILDDR